MSNLIGILEYAKIMIERFSNREGIAIDMTLGKGNDTFYLADKFKEVYAFDIQNEAIEISKEKLAVYDNIQLIKDSHVNFDNYVKEQVDLFIYNLGYLPGFNQDITTLSESTIKSLEKALHQLKEKGIIILVVYIGHQEGYEESLVIEEYINKLDKSHYKVSKYQVLSNQAPYVVCINKK